MEESALHPLEQLCQSLLRNGGKNKEPTIFSPGADRVLCDALDRYLGGEELTEATDTLLDLADDIEDQLRSPGTAQILREIVGREVVSAALRNIQEKNSRAAWIASAEALGFIGGGLPRLTMTAAKGDAVRLDSFKIPRRC